MKKAIIILLGFTLLYFNSIAQKDSTKDTVAVLSLKQVNEIASYIQIQASGKADIRPETWNYIIQMLSKSIMIVPKEKPNTTKLKK